MHHAWLGVDKTKMNRGDGSSDGTGEKGNKIRQCHEDARPQADSHAQHAPDAA
ncbi:hypothetical protein AA0313_0541 [Acetobacter indonesiensis NRIC 0313]|uniref:Uncharacterized protein n=1 Tax=Acetobacter indonesiensis TaxID=104101 RepID=A0A6N3T3G0_9PROT|nr:hypothetical protein Abin_015_131 [Acetobacter indonesiensis]GBQ54365.1 hypothetical protein AA0313_0541 [Acetobacter indonesiensis NRIC 0313]GEN02414.1 hypothetical protein AIN02nite_04390 [Acetobacter indonesiensis]